MSEARENVWFDEMLKRPIETQPFGIEIEIEDEWILIGNTLFFNFDKFSRCSEIGIVIGEKEYWNKGYGTKALNLVLKHGYESLNLNRISLQVYSLNERVMRAYNKVGFVHEGTLRKAVYRKGKYYDIHNMSIFRKEWTPTD